MAAGLGNITGRSARWSFKLREYDYEVVTCPGRLHSVPDALSLLPRCDAFCVKIQQLEPKEDRAGYTLPSEEALRCAYLEDPTYSKPVEYFENQGAKEPH